MLPKNSRTVKSAKRAGARENQQLRTRQDLLRAAGRLMQHGERPPSLEEIAAEAMVSRATAYRYFPTVDALLVEAPLDAEVPKPEELFASVKSNDPVERIDLAEAALHRMAYANQARLKAMLAHSLRREPQAKAPSRQNRRLPLIEAALVPARSRLDKVTYVKLCAALAIVFGTESMVVLTDVYPVGEDVARSVKSWTVRTLVRAALAESRAHGAAKGR